jgi:hypothetical protein
MVPIQLKALLEDCDSVEAEEKALNDARQHVMEQERDEYEALEEAIPDLKRLERYEQRVSSRKKRALYDFVHIKLMRRIGT